MHETMEILCPKNKKIVNKNITLNYKLFSNVILIVEKIGGLDSRSVVCVRAQSFGLYVHRHMYVPEQTYLIHKFIKFRGCLEAVGDRTNGKTGLRTRSVLQSFQGFDLTILKLKGNINYTHHQSYVCQ